MLYIEEQGSYIMTRTAQTYDEVVKDLILCEKVKDLILCEKSYRYPVLWSGSRLRGPFFGEAGARKSPAPTPAIVLV